jgi:threonine/homoserine/homoserine lactone efflux protein
MALTPGPNMVYLVSRSISQGWRAGMMSLAGTAVGALYLLWLAYKTLRPGGKSLFETSELPRDSCGKLFRMGLLTNLLNPKVAILYLAVIPQFVDPTAGNLVAQGSSSALSRSPWVSP